MKKVVKLSESDLNRIVKRVINEDTREPEKQPITIELIKKVIKSNLEDGGYDLSDVKTRRRLNQEIDKLANNYYDTFINRLDYMVEDYNWKEFLNNIEY
jgi:hypothetical protein